MKQASPEAIEADASLCIHEVSIVSGACADGIPWRMVIIGKYCEILCMNTYFFCSRERAPVIADVLPFIEYTEIGLLVTQVSC